MHIKITFAQINITLTEINKVLALIKVLFLSKFNNQQHFTKLTISFLINKVVTPSESSYITDNKSCTQYFTPYKFADNIFKPKNEIN